MSNNKFGITLSAREFRKIRRKNRRYAQQIKRHPEREPVLVSSITSEKLRDIFKL
jgi:hypothetical protein